MPLYEYQCKACGATQEFMQKMSDAAPEECPSCHSGPLVKLLSRTAFILKGNGWYVTDFRDNGKKPAAPSSDSAGSKDDAPKSATASADKPAPSTETKTAEAPAKESAPAKAAT